MNIVIPSQSLRLCDSTEKYNIELTLDELEFLVDLTSVDYSPTGKNQPQEMENNSPSKETK